MIQFIKNLFKRDEDPTLTLLRKKFRGSYKGFNDTEQGVLMLRLSGMSAKSAGTALDLTPEQVARVEAKILEKLSQ